jgi:hypothetical protein
MKNFLTALLAFCLAWVPSLSYAAFRGGGGLELSMTGMVWALIYIIIIACIIGLLWFLLNYVGPMLGEPIFKFAKIAFLVIVVLFLVIMLLRLAGAIQ